MASEAQLDIPKPTIKRIVKEKLAATAGSGEGAKADVQLNKEALLAFGESAKVIALQYPTKSAAAGLLAALHHSAVFLVQFPLAQFRPVLPA
jgi:hypothetical protein